jgi:hypothetical protein
VIEQSDEINLGFRFLVQTGHPYSDGTRSSQLTLAFDVILL